MKIVKKLANCIAETKFASKAIADRASLKEIKVNPTAKKYLGIFLMCFSYILEFLAIGSFGAISIYLKEPKILIIGGPFLFVIAHLIFFTGMYLAGGKYLMVFFRWATRITLEKLIEQ